MEADRSSLSFFRGQVEHVHEELWVVGGVGEVNLDELEQRATLEERYQILNGSFGSSHEPKFREGGEVESLKICAKILLVLLRSCMMPRCFNSGADLVNRFNTCSVYGRDDLHSATRGDRYC